MRGLWPGRARHSLASVALRARGRGVGLPTACARTRTRGPALPGPTPAERARRPVQTEGGCGRGGGANRVLGLRGGRSHRPRRASRPDAPAEVTQSDGRALSPSWLLDVVTAGPVAPRSSSARCDHSYSRGGRGPKDVHACLPAVLPHVRPARSPPRRQLQGHEGPVPAGK